ncbi:MAG TPA: hypothetical protein VKF32_06435 [Thermoanaerobaculia bacterium]|nr:hypothetical protein [Thermoanaerobaculia bacterium]
MASGTSATFAHAAALTLAAAVGFPACTTHAPRRLPSPAEATAIATSVQRLADPSSRREAAEHAVEIHPKFTLAFVEFDDQGRLWSRAQLDLLDRTLAAEARRPETYGVGIIFFMHGWKHDADVCDTNVACFRTYLAQIAADTEAAAHAAGTGVKPPRIVGVYAGWRGLSVTVPALRNLSFWSRKKVAERIGAGELIEVLTHLDQFARDENARGRNRAVLNIIGHSFGGTAIYSALANALKARFVEAFHRRGRVPVDDNVVQGFGDLVVLVNPAFEASLYAPFEDLLAEFGPFSRRQTPVLVIVGSESDFPNRTWFRLGRGIDALFQRTGPRSPRKLLTTAVGNYLPFSSHRLEAAGPSFANLPLASVSSCICRLPFAELPFEESQRLGASIAHLHEGELKASEELYERSACEAGLALGGAHLTCRPGVDPSRPIWHVRATDDVVHGHSGFFTRPFLDFLRYVIMDALSKKAVK